MSRALLICTAALLLAFGPVRAARAETELMPIPVQSGGPDRITGIVVAMGGGAVAGVMIASATLPAALGLASPLIGAIGGGVLGHWVYVEATRPPMLRPKPATLEAEPPSLFLLATELRGDH